MTKNAYKGQKPTVPINYAQLFEDLLRKEDIEERYVKPYIKKMEFLEDGCKLPSFHFRLEDLGNDNLYTLMKKNIDVFLYHFRESLIEIISFNTEIKNFIEVNGFEDKELNIILDDDNFERFPILDDFSKSWSIYLKKLIKIRACFMTQGLDKKPYSKSITYFCDWHSRKRKKNYPYGRKISSFMRPTGCSHSKCNNKEMEVIDEEDYTIGTFTICERDFKAKQEFKSCFIFRDVDYFIEKVHDINISEEVEILGILRKDFTKLGKRDEIPDYYIDVIDIKILKVQKIDEKIIKTLQEKIANPSYVELLIESVHPLSFLVDIYYPIKFLITVSVITGGSWNRIRDTLNSLIIGSKESFKSNIEKRIQNKVGHRHVFRQEVGKKGITYAGLFGTTERGSKGSTPDIRYGVQTIYSHGTLIYDEFQNLNSELLDDLIRRTENGFYNITQDGIDQKCDNHGSLVLSQNLMVNNEDGSYNKDSSLETNLGWDKKNFGSRIDRIDLYYLCPPLDTFTAMIINKNESIETTGQIDDEISKILQLEDYEFPEKISTFNEKIDYLHHNFFHHAKGLYRNSTHSKEVLEAIEKFYTQILNTTENIYDVAQVFSIRAKGTLKRFLRALSCLWFRDVVSIEDYNYLIDNCLKYILRFKDSNLINKEYPDKNQIFRDIFTFEIIDQNIEKVDLKEIIEHLKAYLKRTYYSTTPLTTFEKKMDNYFGKGYGLKNYLLKKLLVNNGSWLKIKGYKVVSKRGKGNLTTIEKILDLSDENINSNETPTHFNRNTIKNLLKNSEFREDQDKQKVLEIYELISNIFSENENQPIEYSGLKQSLSVFADPISRTLLASILSYLIKINLLVKDPKGFYKLNK